MSATIDGTAVAMIVESTAIRPVASMTAPRTGPRSERRPTPSLLGLLVVVSPVTSLPRYAGRVPLEDKTTRTVVIPSFLGWACERSVHRCAAGARRDRPG